MFVEGRQMIARMAALLVVVLAFAFSPAAMLFAQESEYEAGDLIVFQGSAIALREAPLSSSPRSSTLEAARVVKSLTVKASTRKAKMVARRAPQF